MNFVKTANAEWKVIYVGNGVRKYSGGHALLPNPIRT